MPCRLTSSKKRPWPWTRRLSSLRGTLCPTAPRWRVVVPSVSTAVTPTLRGRDDGLHDVPVPSAATDVALEADLDLLLRRARVLREQRARAHQHPGCAIAALERMVIGERLLKG